MSKSTVSFFCLAIQKPMMIYTNISSERLNRISLPEVRPWVWLWWWTAQLLRRWMCKWDRPIAMTVWNKWRWPHRKRRHSAAHRRRRGWRQRARWYFRCGCGRPAPPHRANVCGSHVIASPCCRKKRITNRKHKHTHTRKTVGEKAEIPSGIRTIMSCTHYE